MTDNRFQRNGDLVEDRRTGLVWPARAQLSVTGLPWREAFEFVREMNRKQALGHDDWRLPNRRELYSLIDHAASGPALPPGHPFEEVWQGWYWTATTSAKAPAYAWRVQMLGGRMFYGKKDEDSLVWPVRGTSEGLFATGQTACFGGSGELILCNGTGQDGELRMGAPWPEPRFRVTQSGTLDIMTGLEWTRNADLASGLVSREQAEQIVNALGQRWRLPEIMELESLTDCSRSDPALPAGHPFTGVREAYWSATDSGLDADWAYCLYYHKGAVGVGYKPNRDFSVWAVRNQDET
ncbi:DUF1566 domain-containing protein [Pseudodesulfovibrio cashew]|uniref:DUF1566 domain-containing protein n=1 Tax=Pseudodesulfovibrio cashew TaxID=2678688 RepID=A0A6I6JJL5_9BACT|nr:DUF1566 domain-containing protein [Pseudodesulfovibrio cashew]QGY40317.1 DUF1566 domain-containing protein [Pseudodesulfovibrio cashew]